jgi:hypothetical protein
MLVFIAIGSHLGELRGDLGGLYIFSFFFFFFNILIIS